jgi:predicted SprT family Zn-dependent metalloprotease
MSHRENNGHRKGKDSHLLASVRDAIATGSASGALARIVRRWSAQWEVPDLTETVSFHFNGRLRTTIARWVVGPRRLELSAQFFRSGIHCQAILCHELAHAAAVLKYGRKIRGHGREWRGLVLAAGFKPSAFRPAARPRGLVPDRPRSRTIMYEHRCPVCHAVRYGRKPVKAWRCIECVGAGLAGHLYISQSLAVRSHQ